MLKILQNTLSILKKKKKKPKIYITKTLQNAYFKSGAVFRNTQKHFMFDKKVQPK